MTYRDVEQNISKLCRQYGLPHKLLAASYSEKFPVKRIDINAQTDNWKKRLADAKYVVKYIEEDDRYIIWENRPGRLTFYLSRKDYLSAKDTPSGFALKGKVYKWKGEERFWVLSPQQLEQFVANIANQ